MNKEKFNIYEINDMKADYCLGNLSSEDTAIFEKSIVEYPDIQAEIINIKMNLTQVDAARFNEYMERKARNVSVHVQERLSSKSSKISFIKNPYFVASTVTSVFIILIFVFTYNKNKITFQDYAHKETTENLIMKLIGEDLDYEQELLEISKDNSLKSHILGFDEFSYKDTEIYSEESLYDEMLYNEQLDFMDISDMQLNYLSTNNSLDYVFKDIINEELINNILEEIENENFN